jgi:predicted DNA-binding transcriptional regulator AlpA
MRFLRLPKVVDRVGIRKGSIYKKIAAGEFPSPYPLGPHARAVGWLESDIDRWIEEQRLARSDKPASGKKCKFCGCTTAAKARRAHAKTCTACNRPTTQATEVARQ